MRDSKEIVLNSRYNNSRRQVWNGWLKNKPIKSKVIMGLLSNGGEKTRKSGIVSLKRSNRSITYIRVDTVTKNNDFLVPTS